MAETPAYEVTAIRYGSLRARKSDLYYRFESYGEPDAEVEMAYYFWLLRAGERVVVVDTGFRRETAESRGRTLLVDPLDALAELGVDPERVETVVLTHLHYDHTGNLAAFPNAELIVPRRELEFWTGPLAGRAQFGPHAEPADVELIREANAAGRVRLTAGEEEILPGVTAIEVGGHSPGQQLILVEGESGKILLTSDAVHFYEELELDRPFGVIADLEQMYLAFDRISELAGEGATLVAGHDPAVVDRFAVAGAGTEPPVRVFGG
jgi:glyoxylase-like metal-dependent hydrolase (beta-lactamase superfamily II)